MVEVGQGWEGSTYARKRSKIYTISVFRNIRRQIIFEIFGSNIFFSVCRYFKTDIFLRYTLYVQKDSKKRIKQERKTKIRKKKDGSRHIVQVRRGRSIQKWKKNIRYPYLFEQRYSLSVSFHDDTPSLYLSQLMPETSSFRNQLPCRSGNQWFQFHYPIVPA